MWGAFLLSSPFLASTGLTWPVCSTEGPGRSNGLFCRLLTFSCCFFITTCPVLSWGASTCVSTHPGQQQLEWAATNAPKAMEKWRETCNPPVLPGWERLLSRAPATLPICAMLPSLAPGAGTRWRGAVLARCWRGGSAPGVPGQRVLAVRRPCGGGCVGRLVSRGQGTGRRVRVGSKEPLSLRRPVGALNAEFSLGALGRCAMGPPVAAALSARRRSAELTASGRTRR